MRYSNDGEFPLESRRVEGVPPQKNTEPSPPPFPIQCRNMFLHYCQRDLVTNRKCSFEYPTYLRVIHLQEKSPPPPLIVLPIGEERLTPFLLGESASPLRYRVYGYECPLGLSCHALNCAATMYCVFFS